MISWKRNALSFILQELLRRNWIISKANGIYTILESRSSARSMATLTSSAFEKMYYMKIKNLSFQMKIVLEWKITLKIILMTMEMFMQMILITLQYAGVSVPHGFESRQAFISQFNPICPCDYTHSEYKIRLGSSIWYVLKVLPESNILYPDTHRYKCVAGVKKCHINQNFEHILSERCLSSFHICSSDFLQFLGYTGERGANRVLYW